MLGTACSVGDGSPKMNNGAGTQETRGGGQGGLQEKRERVKRILQSFDRTIIAFSAGVDSTLLVKIAREVLGRERVLSVTADSPSLAREDLSEAHRLADTLDVEHLVINTQEVSDFDYRANSPGRCYICKRTLFHAMDTIAKQRGIPVILYGAIGDDSIAERPGQRAALECGVRAPLQEAGLTKSEVRELAQRLGLPNWNRPQNACLSSRIPHGLEVTEQKLKQIEAAEAFLHSQGFHQVRVRHLGAHARIEVSREQLVRFDDAVFCQTLVEVFSTLGFSIIGVDRRGYHSGGTDDSLIDEQWLS